MRGIEGRGSFGGVLRWEVRELGEGKVTTGGRELCCLQGLARGIWEKEGPRWRGITILRSPYNWKQQSFQSFFVMCFSYFLSLFDSFLVLLSMLPFLFRFRVLNWAQTVCRSIFKFNWVRGSDTVETAWQLTFISLTCHCFLFGNISLLCLGKNSLKGLWSFRF